MHVHVHHHQRAGCFVRSFVRSFVRAVGTARQTGTSSARGAWHVPGARKQTDPPCDEILSGTS